VARHLGEAQPGVRSLGGITAKRLASPHPSKRRISREGRLPPDGPPAAEPLEKSMRVACPIKSVWAEYEPGVVHSVDFDAPLIATHQPQRDTAFPMDPGKNEDAQL